jgi:uncharacterized protein (DUF2267 family)
LPTAQRRVRPSGRRAVSGGKAEEIASQLPDELPQPLTRVGGDPAGFGLDEFYRRVAEKEGIDVDEATEHVSAVMTVLGQAISDGELQDVRSEFSREFYPLLQR